MGGVEAKILAARWLSHVRSPENTAGSYHYKYASGHEGDSALAGFAVRGSELVVYIAAGFEGRDVLLARLGKLKTGKVCVYIRRLANVDLKVLETLVARSVAESKRRRNSLYTEVAAALILKTFKTLLRDYYLDSFIASQRR